MISFHNIQELDARIKELKKIQQLQEDLIASTFHDIKEDLQPRNLLRNSINSLVKDAELRKNVIEKILEVTALWAAKKWLEKRSDRTSTPLAVSGLLSEAVRLAFENKEQLKAYGTALFNRVFKKNPTSGNSEQKESGETG